MLAHLGSSPRPASNSEESELFLDNLAGLETETYRLGHIFIVRDRPLNIVEGYSE